MDYIAARGERAGQQLGPNIQHGIPQVRSNPSTYQTSTNTIIVCTPEQQGPPSDGLQGMDMMIAVRLHSWKILS